MSWKIHHMDVKTTFFNGKIEEEVYIEQPEGFETFDCESHVCRLKQVLYGLKQAPHASYSRIDSYFTRLGFTNCEADANLYHIVVEVFISQGKYTNEVLKRFHMESSKPMETPLASNWRKEDDASGEVVEATVYKQLVGSLRRTEGVKLQGFTDVDWAESPSDRKSTSGGIFSIGATVVSSYNRKQRSVSLSSAKVEYIVASQVAYEAIWIRKILVGLFGQQMDPTKIYCDNQTCIKLSDNPVFHDRSKHIDI
eukprot:PITA_17953